MTRRSLGYASVAAAILLAAAAFGIWAAGIAADAVVGAVALQPLLVRGVTAAAVLAAAIGAYLAVGAAVTAQLSTDRRIVHARNLLRVGFGAVAVVAVAGVRTDRWVGVLASLGVVGFAITFALHRPILSLVAWVYVVLNHPYNAGDRVGIADVCGDGIEVGSLSTALWEVGGRLVSSGQPSSRVVTVPNAAVLPSQVVDDTALFEYGWSEATIQVAYETDPAFARTVMVEEATDLLGTEIRRAMGEYRGHLDRTAVDLDAREEPTVNVVQQESWVELRLRVLTRSRRVTRGTNALYEWLRARFNDAPGWVKFPMSRNR